MSQLLFVFCNLLNPCDSVESFFFAILPFFICGHPSILPPLCPPPPPPQTSENSKCSIFPSASNQFQTPAFPALSAPLHLRSTEPNHTHTHSLDFIFLEQKNLHPFQTLFQEFYFSFSLTKSIHFVCLGCPLHVLICFFFLFFTSE